MVEIVSPSNKDRPDERAAFVNKVEGYVAAVDIWREPLSVGATLPEMPLHLKGGPCVVVPLEATYAEACRTTRVDMAGVLAEQA